MSLKKYKNCHCKDSCDCISETQKEFITKTLKKIIEEQKLTNNEINDLMLLVNENSKAIDDIINGIIDDEVIRTKIDEKLLELELAYTPKLIVLEGKVEANELALETKASELELEVERHRIDNLIAVEETTDNAETVDIRVGGNGVIYSSAGNAVRAISTGEGIVDEAIGPTKVNFLTADSTENMFDGSFKNAYLQGAADGSHYLSSSNALVGVIEIKPNTSYSVSLSPDIATRLKIVSSTKIVEIGETLDGSLSLNIGTTIKSYLVTTGEDDKYLYVNATSVGFVDTPYLKVVESTTIIPVKPGERTYPIVPKDISVYSKKEVDNLINSLPIDNIRKIKVNKIGDSIKIHIPSPISNKYTTLNFSKDVKPSKNLDIWRITNLSISDNEFNPLYTLCNQYDVDGVIKIDDEEDYIGGYHGYEQLTDIYFFLNNSLKSLAGNFSEDVETVKVIVKSNVYSHSTTTTAFIKYKVIEINKDAVHIYSKYITQYNCKLNVARFALMSIEKNSDETPLLKHFTNNVSILPVTVKPPEDSTNGQTLEFNPEINMFELFSENLYVKTWRGPTNESTKRGSIVDFVTRLKTYLDIARETNITTGKILECDAYFTIYS